MRKSSRKVRLVLLLWRSRHEAKEWEHSTFLRVSEASDWAKARDARQCRMSPFFFTWPAHVGVLTLFVTPGSPWENGHIERFNGKLRDQRLTRQLFATLWEVTVFTEHWWYTYNRIRPHSALGFNHPHRRPSHRNGPDSHGG